MTFSKALKDAAPSIKKVVNKGIKAYEIEKAGHVYAKLPFKYKCIEGKTYLWCSCGWSRTQPFCDGTHADFRWKISLKPLRFECKETKEYWFCQCKQTSLRPFCDGTHNTELVLKATSTIQSPLVQPKQEDITENPSK